VNSCSNCPNGQFCEIPTAPDPSQQERRRRGAILSASDGSKIVRIHLNTSEAAILRHLKTRLKPRSTKSASSSLAVGIGDDAAVWRARPGYQTILTCDWFLEGTHFSDRHPPESVGWKCLARAVSDIAAMGAEPRCFLLSLAIPAARTGRWFKGFLAGLRSASRRLNCPIAGGDTTRRNEILINITVIGECQRGRAVLRSKARPGDAIFVTGRLGEAEYGLRLLSDSSKQASLSDRRLQKHLYPMPRLAAGTWLAKHRLAGAMMDLSDGLSSDLARLCKASGVGAVVESERLPRVSITVKDPNKNFAAVQLALHGGEDYELLFTVSPKNLTRIPKSIGRLRVTRIGTIKTGSKILLVDQNGGITSLQNSGWDPFR
jgi:thiamine-monophosphate kinase